MTKLRISEIKTVGSGIISGDDKSSDMIMGMNTSGEVEISVKDVRVQCTK